MGTSLLRVAWIQNSPTEACKMKSAANDATRSAAICPSMRSVATRSAGMKKEGRHPDYQTDSDEKPPRPTMISEVPRPGPTYELERCQGQVDTAQYYVQRDDDWEPEEAVIVRLMEVVGGGRAPRASARPAP